MFTLIQCGFRTSAKVSLLTAVAVSLVFSTYIFGQSIDPWIQTAEVTAADSFPNDLFGRSIAIDGSTLVVGAPYHSVGSNQEEGAAYVFVKSGAGWVQQAELTESDGAEMDHFGFSVGVSGNTVVVGSGSGRVYVFFRTSATWTQQAELTASVGELGSSVAVNGSTIVVGAPGQVVGSKNGAAFVFVGNGGVWTQQAELTGSDEGGVDQFGLSVAVYGSTAVVGAPTHQVGANSQQGAAYVFVNNGRTWSQQAELTSSDGAKDDQFGLPVAINGGTIVSGAHLHGAGSNQYQGAAYVFARNGATWSQQAELTSSDNAGDDQFGTSVAVNGSTIVVGVPGHSTPFYSPIGGPGAAYMFGRNGTVWSQQAEVLASDGDGLGTAVAISGSTAVAGAPGLNSTEHGGGGAAYVYGSSGPLYTLSVAPNSLGVAPGGQGTATVTITPFNGFTGSVSLSGGRLPSGVTASFNPNPATGSTTVTLTASATAAEGPASLVINGTSGTLTQTTPLALTVLAAPEASLSTTATSFGNVVINTTSSSRTIRIKNTGQDTLSFTKPEVITPGTYFKISSNGCTSLLFAGNFCDVSVEFIPTTLGKQTASLIFTDDAANSPQTVSLTGFGVEPAVLTPATLTYAAQKVGTTSAARTFTLNNYQSVALSSIVISTTGDFAVSATTCASSLAAKSKCTINVTFKPTQTGTRTGQLTVKDNASNGPQSSALKGTGD